MEVLFALCIFGFSSSFNVIYVVLFALVSKQFGFCFLRAFKKLKSFDAPVSITLLYGLKDLYTWGLVHPDIWKLV